MILKSDGTTYSHENTTCNGVTNSTVKTNKQCQIPISLLAASPFTLTKGTLIKVKAAAING
jgi:hypothetical protein